MLYPIRYKMSVFFSLVVIVQVDTLVAQSLRLVIKTLTFCNFQSGFINKNDYWKYRDSGVA